MSSPWSICKPGSSKCSTCTRCSRCSCCKCTNSGSNNNNQMQQHLLHHQLLHHHGGLHQQQHLLHQQHQRLHQQPAAAPAAPAAAPAAPPAASPGSAAATGPGDSWLRQCRLCGEDSYWREDACLNPHCKVTGCVHQKEVQDLLYKKTRRCKISCIKKLGGARSLLHFSHVCTVDFLAAKASVYRPGFDLTVPQRSWGGVEKKDIGPQMFWKTSERWQKNKGSWSKIYVLF